MLDRNPDYDVIIAGAGPAGCMAALKAPAGMRVLLIDARALPRDVTCGGILSPWSLEQIEPYGIPDRIFCRPRIIGWSLLDWDLERTGGLRDGSYFNVSRNRFDEWLLELAGARERVEVWPGTRFLAAQAYRSGDGLRVVLGRNGTRLTVTARFLVGADGSTSAVRRFLGGMAPGRWVTIQEKARSGGAAVDRFLACVGTSIDFYGWVIPKDDELVIGAGYDSGRGNPLRRFGQFRQDLEERYGIGGSQVLKPRARPATRLRSLAEIFPGRGNILLAGEAAGLICPWSGEGIAYALYSGALAGKALTTASPQDEYRRAVRRLWPVLARDIGLRKISRRSWRRQLAASIYPGASLRRASGRAPTT